MLSLRKRSKSSSSSLRRPSLVPPSGPSTSACTREGETAAGVTMGEGRLLVGGEGGVVADEARGFWALIHFLR